jgi:RimJ/RimL family protein N-acetyltransferase/NhaP-type Na+/H+ or K+/H+ antiporter
MFEIIFLISIIIGLGFASRFAFEKTRIPESIILIATGFCLGPLGLISFFSIPKIELEYLQSVAPVIGAIAIVSIIFEAGFRLKARDVAGNILNSVLAAFLHTFTSIIVIFLILNFILDWNLKDSLVLSAIFGGISSYTVYYIAPLLRTTNATRSRLYIEASLSSLIVCIIAIALMKYSELEAAKVAINVGTVLFWLFSVSFIIGLIVGIMLLFAMLKLKIKRAGFLPLFALVLAIYYIDFVYLGGIGVISLAIIGFVLANSDDFFKTLKMHGSFEVDDSFRFFQQEISLFIGAFFFVYLGMIFRPEQLTVQNILIGILILLGIFFARASVVGIMHKISKSQKHENFLQVVMLPRDILSAGLATFIFIYPNSVGFGTEIVTITIVLSTIASSIRINQYEKIFKNSLLFRKEVKLKDGRVVIIRSFTRDDFGKLRVFFNKLVEEGAYIAIDQRVSNAEEREIDEESIAKINRKEMICWVVEYENRIVGRAVAEKMPRRERDNVSLSFYIAKEFRGVGLGTTLIRMIIKESMQMFKPHNIYLTVYSDNKKAIKLYEREGFEKAGVLPGWMKHNDKYLDRIYMVYNPKKRQNKNIRVKN